MGFWSVISEGFSAVKSVDKLVTGVAGFFKKKKKRRKDDEEFDAKHKTVNYQSKYHNK